MRVVLAALLTLALAGGAAVAVAQSASPQDLTIEKKRREKVVHPLPPPAVVEDDAERAVADNARRDERAAREATQRPWHRPELDYDVHQAIQQHRIHRPR